jgi:dipeptidyl-peptidase III
LSQDTIHVGAGLTPDKFGINIATAANIFKEGELEEALCTQKFGISEFQQKAHKFYNSDVIISVGYRVKSMRGTQFRQWATKRLNEYIRKGFAMDDERLKNLGGAGSVDEFAYTEDEAERAKKYGLSVGTLHTDLHEIIGHGSGQLRRGVSDPTSTLKNYYSPIEEARADLVGLYFLLDPKMVELGLMEDLDAGRTQYESYIRNGLLTQLVRIRPGANIEQAHMRARKLISEWALEKGQKDNVIERIHEDGKTYFVVNDHEKLRKIFGELLKEIQRIKSEGDYNAARRMIENYAVKVDNELHIEVLERWDKLNIAPYTVFINPVLVPVYEGDKIIDIKIEYPDDFLQQMLYYGKNYSYLPMMN